MKMAKKADILASVLAAVALYAKEQKFTEKQTQGLNDLLNDLLAPKSAGLSVNVDEVTKKDASGKITHIMCALSGKFLPATKEFFYEDIHGKGIAGTGLKRLSRQAEAIRKQHAKLTLVSERAITADIVDKKLTPDQGKAKLAELKASKPDYSAVSDKLPEKAEKSEKAEKPVKAEKPAKEAKAEATPSAY